MDRAVIDLGRSIFAAGQAYVALSRVRTLEGVALESLVRESITKVDARVLAEYERLGIPFGGTGLVAPSSNGHETGGDAMERDVGLDEVPGAGLDGSDVEPNVGEDRLEGSSLEDTLLTPEGLLNVLGTAAAVAAASVVISSLHQGVAATAGQNGGVGEGQGGHGYFSESDDDDAGGGPEAGMRGDDEALGGDPQLTPYRRMADRERSPQVCKIPKEIKEDGTWEPFDHNMSVWPPTNIVKADGTAPTFSWMYMPLIMDALGRSDVFTFPRPPWWAEAVARLEAAFAASWPPVHLASPDLNACWDNDGDNHLVARYQEKLMCLDRDLGDLVTNIAWDLVFDARVAMRLLVQA